MTASPSTTSASGEVETSTPDQASHRPLLSVLIPVYNERATIAEILRRVQAAPIDKEVIVVDDGSRDGTREILQALAAADPALRLHLMPMNRGKGAAMREAIALARGHICIVQDADLEYDPQDYAALIAPITSGRADVVYGSRPRHPDNRYPLDLFRVGSFVLTTLANVLFGAHITDEPVGYKVFRTEVLQSLTLRCQGFEFCPEVTAKVRKRGWEIFEVPIRYHRRTIREGKKINWKDGLMGIWTLFKYRVTD